MVEKIKAELGAALGGVEIRETEYRERGYHLSCEASPGELLKAARFFDECGFYLAAIVCVDYREYLELVYIFANHSALCKTKVTLKLDPAKPAAPTLSAIFDCAYWHEREIREFYGVLFDGHPNLTYLFLHEGIDAYPLRKEQVLLADEDKKALGAFRPEEGEDTFFVNLGPQHPSTHGVLRVVLKMDGEYIQSAEPVLGYLHRMHEKMAENRSYLQFLPNPSRMDYLGAMSFNLGHVTAVERLCGIAVPDRANCVRVIATELNRISSHLLWLGAYLADLGALTPFLFVFDDREQINDVLEAVTGSRLTYCYFRFGGLYNDVDEAFIAGTKAFIERMRGRFGLYEKLVGGNVIFINRTRGIGVIEKERARKYAVSGPVLRGAGIAMDMRKAEPCAAYSEMDFEIPVGTRGDALDMYRVRVREMETALDIIEQALARLTDGPVMAEKVPKKLKPPKGDLYHTVETPRGELGIYIVSDESDRPYRMKWRVPSFSNLMIFPELARGNLLADAVAILGSLDLVIPEIDR
ncbi:MAG: NADH-quinone oxidoreductase subunit D [Proteobacteria bacterium]|nr:NADH-quinone oxidoreductase subunit D [Pseudomonadota bacterium]MBU2260681.1 NADH-quinone oxidoreductase subunit D [Pseudomonadota bacterium]